MRLLEGAPSNPEDTWCEVLDERWEENVKSIVSTFFMLLVGISLASESTCDLLMAQV